MGSRQFLVAVSAAQLAAGVSGQVVALRDRRSFDIDLIGWRGQPDRVARDSWLLGTGLSAPVVMLSTQVAAAVLLARKPSRAATRLLGALGATMTCGYLIEREFRAAVSPAGWNAVTTTIATAGFTLAIAMAVSGLRSQSAAERTRDAYKERHKCAPSTAAKNGASPAQAAVPGSRD